MAVPLRLTKLFIQTSAIHSGTFRTKAPPLAIEGRWLQNLLFEAGGEMIRKSQNKIKTNYYEKIFTFNFCRNAGSVQRAGARCST